MKNITIAIEDLQTQLSIIQHLHRKIVSESLRQNDTLDQISGEMLHQLRNYFDFESSTLLSSGTFTA